MPDAPAENLPATRFGISVSQKVSKKAVVRNLLKRQVKAAVRQLLPQIHSGWSIVIGVRPSAQGCEYVEILRELEQLLAAAEVLDGY
jgi:ribonuclease P protein component